MADEQTPETQDTSKEETSEETLIYGKYKTQEEAEAAFKELERSATESKEALDREQRLNALLATEDRSQPQEPQQEQANYQSLNQVFDEETTQAVSQMMQQEREKTIAQARAESRRMIEDYQVRQDTEKKFYKEYDDLQSFKDDVDSEANRLALELGERASKVPMKDLMKEVAKRTREKLSAQKSKLTKSPLYVENGEVVEPTVEPKDKVSAPTTETERTQKFFDEEVTAFNERKFKPLRG